MIQETHKNSAPIVQTNYRMPPPQHMFSLIPFKPEPRHGIVNRIHRPNPQLFRMAISSYACKDFQADFLHVARHLHCLLFLLFFPFFFDGFNLYHSLVLFSEQHECVFWEPTLAIESIFCRSLSNVFLRSIYVIISYCWICMRSSWYSDWDPSNRWPQLKLGSGSSWILW